MLSGPFFFPHGRFSASLPHQHFTREGELLTAVLTAG